ncbi:hypothetical protein [Kribbella caucasensis]|nr:hypothetical protein [Kribbella sp. VKM Ac-2527]
MPERVAPWISTMPTRRLGARGGRLATQPDSMDQDDEEGDPEASGELRC